jgi:hypothetical protein
MQAPFPKRLPHIVTRADWATLLTSTYAESQSVDDEEAHERLTRALGSSELLDVLYTCLAKALGETQGPRTTDDELLDKLSAAIQKRRGRVRAAAVNPALAAALVRIDLEIGVAADAMRDALRSPKGKALLDAGLAQLGTHLVKELIK